MTMMCQSCGAEVRPAFRFCHACGSTQLGVVSAAQAPTPAWHGSPPVVQAPTSSVNVSGMGYAGFWRRTAACTVDQIIASVFFGLPLVLVMDISSVMTVLAFNLVGLVLGWLYYALQESSRHQATFGKRALGLVVSDMNGQRLSFARATGRHFGRFLSILICFAGYFMALFTERRQTLHDKLAGTVVLCRGA